MKYPKTRQQIEEKFWTKIYLAKARLGSDNYNCKVAADTAVELLKERNGE